MIEKLIDLRSGDGMTDLFRACWYTDFPPIGSIELEWLLERWPWIPDDYQQFLRSSNGMILNTAVLFGVGDEHPYPLASRQVPAGWYDARRFVAIGLDPASITLVLREGGGVCTISSDPPPDEPQELCASFAELIDSVLCGPRYSEYLGSSGRENDWFEFLKSKGWAGA